MLKRNRQRAKKVTKKQVKTNPLLQLRESGKKLWEHEPADEYVNRLREGWH